MITYDKPYFNSSVWVIAEKNDAGLTIQRHKFESEYKANQFFREHTEQQKPQASENKIQSGSKENKASN